jgi:hypothetical protein
VRAKEAVEGGGKALCVGGADDGVVDVEAFIVVEVDNGPLNATVQYSTAIGPDRHSVVQLPCSHSTTTKCRVKSTPVFTQHSGPNYGEMVI